MSIPFSARTTWDRTENHLATTISGHEVDLRTAAVRADGESRSGQPAGVQPEDLALDRADGKIGKSTDLACPGAVRHDDGVGTDGLPVG